MREPSVSILPAALAAMTAEALAAYPNEGCGALAGGVDATGFVCARAQGIRNTEPEPAHAYRLDARELSVFERALEAENSLRVIGFFHSHPDAPARPSRDDLEMAQGAFALGGQRYLYLIIAVNSGQLGERRAWRLNADASAFEELGILEI